MDYHVRRPNVLHRKLQTLHTLNTEHCKLQTGHYKLHTAHLILITAHFTLHTAHCTMYTTHCKLNTAHCTIYSSAVAGVWGGREMGSIVGGMGGGSHCTGVYCTTHYCELYWAGLYCTDPTMSVTKGLLTNFKLIHSSLLNITKHY